MTMKPMKLSNKAVIQIEVLPPSDGRGLEEVSRSGEALRQAQAAGEAAFEHAVSALKGLVHDLHAAIKESDPSQVEVEMGLTVTAEGTLGVVSGKGDCNFKVKLTWTKPSASA